MIAPRTNPRHTSSTAGFTLLEVLLAMVLSTVVLAGLWAALSIHLRMFDAGRTQVEQAQLSRALLHQIAGDLRQAVVDPSYLNHATPPHATEDEQLILTTAFQPDQSSQAAIPQDSLPDSFWTSSTTRHFRFRGGPQQLTFDVHALQMSLTPEPTAASPLPRTISGLSTVQYQFFDETLDSNRSLSAATAATSREVEPQTGIIRRVTSWARLDEESELLAEVEVTDTRDDATLPSASPSTLPPEPPAGGSWDTPFDSSAQLDLDEDLTPEVSQLQFRYYDGLEWLDFWDSDSRRGLPVAVEISLAFQPDSPRQSTPASSDRQLAFDSLAELGQPVYRLVVQMPRGKRTELATEPDTNDPLTSAAPPPDVPTSSPLPMPAPMPMGMP